MGTITPNTQPIFIKDGGLLGSSIRLTNQITQFDGTGTTPVTLYDPSTGSGNGALIESIRIMPLGINVASALRVFIQNSAGGVIRWDFLASIDLPAVTAANQQTISTAGYPKEIVLPPLLSPVPRDSNSPLRGLRIRSSGGIIGVALEQAIVAGVVVFAIGGEY
jgi:hypothetical protein